MREGGAESLVWVNRVILSYAPITSGLHQQADNRRARHHVSKVPDSAIRYRTSGSALPTLGRHQSAPNPGGACAMADQENVSLFPP